MARSKVRQKRLLCESATISRSVSSVTGIWGLDRHDWGGVHFWMAVALLGALSVHVLLHWKWIVCVVRGQPREGSGVRLALGIVGVVAVLALAAAPLVSRIERAGPGRRRGAQTSETPE
jgi:hypothetical protein